MMVVLTHNVACWTFIMGILKAWTFLVVFAVFFTSYLAQKVKVYLTSEIEYFGFTCADIFGKHSYYANQRPYMTFSFLRVSLNTDDFLNWIALSLHS